MIKGVAASLLLSSAIASTAFPKSWEEFRDEYKGSFDSLYIQYSKSFSKHYATKQEEVEHFSLFSDRVKSIFDFNSEKKRTYTKGITKFTDMTADERKHYVMPETKVEKRTEPRSSHIDRDPRSKKLGGIASSNVCDLRPYMTSVKDQQSCGSCWAFGTIAAAEASHFLWAMTDSNGVSASVNDAWQLSEQVLVDCCDMYGCNGCGGGGVGGPLQCAVSIGALPSKVSHPYTATDNETCAHSDFEASAHVEAWYEPCANGDEACVKSYIGGDDCSTFYTTALKTSIEVIDSFYDYVDGVYSDPSCPDDIHNHAVAIVGWGTSEEGQDYWILRNSWGTEWGNQGYFYMERGTNMCCVGCENLFFQ